MEKAAIIIAERSEQRRQIAQRIGSLDLFEQVHFCSSLQEVSWLLNATRALMIFSEAGSVDHEALCISASLANLAKKHRCPLIFFSDSDPVQLHELGILPPGSHCCHYQDTSNRFDKTVRTLLEQSSLQDPGPSDPPLTQKPIRYHSGLYSRFSFDNFLHQEQARSQMTGRPFSLLLIQPQSCPANETRTENWTSFLPELALKVKNLIRNSDLLCHLDEEQLALILPEASSQNARQVLKRIQKSLEEAAHQFPSAIHFNLSLSEKSYNELTDNPLPKI